MNSAFDRLPKTCRFGQASFHHGACQDWVSCAAFDVDPGGYREQALEFIANKVLLGKYDEDTSILVIQDEFREWIAKQTA